VIPRSITPWVEISLEALRHNLLQIRRRVQPAGVIAVVKDAAYGCGAVQVSRALEREGVTHLAVARAAEARSIRQGGVRAELLVMGPMSAEDLTWASQSGVHACASSLDSLAELCRSGLALQVQCNIDTGMGRLGLRPDEIPQAAEILAAGKARLAGLCTHLACADTPATGAAAAQIRALEQCIESLRQRAIVPPMVHVANSAGVANMEWPKWATHARPGIALYGCRTDPAVDTGLDLHQVASLKGQVVRVQPVGRDTPLSYGWTYRTPAPTQIATVNIGYGQGLPRSLSGNGSVLVNGRRHPIAGRVTMDYVMLDVGLHSGVHVGDEAVAMGTQGGECISTDELARAAGTIGYEILCNLGARIPRAYVDGASTVWQDPLLY
jgi:alanine racemase